MRTEEARTIVRRCLGEIAPDADLHTLPEDADLRQNLDLDSMDVFNLVAAIAEEGHVEIPDRDVPRLRTLAAFIDYVAGVARGPAS